MSGVAIAAWRNAILGLRIYIGWELWRFPANIAAKTSIPQRSHISPTPTHARMIATKLLLLLLLLLLPLAAIGERANKDDATITKTKTIFDGGNCLLKFSAIFLLASLIVFSCRNSDSS